MTNKVKASDSVGVVGNTSQPLVVSAFLDNSVKPASTAIVGTATSGPAFFPITVSGPGVLSTVFGDVTGALAENANAILAAERFFANGGKSALFLRTLGAGNCKQRTSDGGNEGRVEKAGFVVGDELINTGTNLLGTNYFAHPPTAGQPGLLGRTYFLSCLMSESAGSTIFSDAGIQDTSVAKPILRGVLFAPSGVILSLSSTYEPNNTPTANGPAIGSFGSSGDGGCNIGTVLDIKKTSSCFTMLLNGHKSTLLYPSEIPLSFDASATHQDLISAQIRSQLDLENVGKQASDSLYFGNVLNTDPTKIQQAGHYLYTYYDIEPNAAVVTGSGAITAGAYSAGEPIALLLTSSFARNTGSMTSQSANTVGVPNFENFEDRFTVSHSPFVISQKISGKRRNLFRLHSFSDGKRRVPLRFEVDNITPKNGGANNEYATFDVAIYNANSPDNSSSVPLYEFTEVNLDPSDKNFIAKRIGDRHAFYDFDNPAKGQKTVVEGFYPVTNPYVRVEVSTEVANGDVPKDLLPVGFRGIAHLITSASNPTGAGSILTGSISDNSTAGALNLGQEILRSVIQPPLPLRERLSRGVLGSEVVTLTGKAYKWGVQFSRKLLLSDPNISTADFKQNRLISNLMAFFPTFHTTLQNPVVGNNAGAADVGGAILDCDRFNNNIFTLEHVAIITGSIANGRDVKSADLDEIGAAIYVRNGRLPSTLLSGRTPGTSSDKVRFIDSTRDFGDDQLRKYLGFNVPMRQAFDGLNVFDIESARMTDVSVFRERLNSSLGKTASSTAAYHKAIDILSEKHEADMELFCIPGIRHRAVTNKAAQAMEEKFNALFITDVEQYRGDGTYVTGSDDLPDIVITTDNFRNRALDTSFAAAFYPNVRINFNALDENGASAPPHEVPGSVAAIGAIARNDQIADVSRGPEGLSRGQILDAVQTNLQLENNEVVRLRNNLINTISPAANSSGVVYFESQLTTLEGASPMKLINNRRLLITIRRRARDIARQFLFASNTRSNRQLLISRFNKMMQGFVDADMIASFTVNEVDNTLDKPRAISDIQNDILVNQQNFRAFGTLNTRGDEATELLTVRAQIFITLNNGDDVQVPAGVPEEATEE